MNEYVKIIFYTTNCLKCSILKRKLDEKGVVYDTVSGDEAVQIMVKAGFSSAPVLKIGDEYKDFGAAISWVKEICK